MTGRIVGAFLFIETFLQLPAADARAARLLERLVGYGINAVFTESESYDDAWIRLAHSFGLRWFSSIACFSDHAHRNRAVLERPELWPVTEAGTRRSPMEWYIGITPTYEDYAEARLDLMCRLVQMHGVDGVMLDFIRWPLHWELECRPGAQPQHCSFDSHTIRQFQQSSHVSVPAQTAAEQASWILTHVRTQWTDFKCAVITRFVREAVRRLRSVRPDLLTGLFVVPLGLAQRELLAGQRIADLSPLVHYVSPMAYHAMLHRQSSWVASVVREAADAAPGKVLPALQVDSREGPVLGSDWGPRFAAGEWREIARDVLQLPGVQGCVAFTGTALEFDNRGAMLRHVLQPNSPAE